MYSNLALYYLDQLGIKPLILKSHNAIQASKQLVVLVANEPSDKAQVLLGRLLQYIGVARDEYLLVNAFSADCVHEKLKVINPVAVLALGLETSSFQELSINCPLIHGHALEDLLLQPMFKKKIFMTLQPLKNTLFLQPTVN